MLLWNNTILRIVIPQRAYGFITYIMEYAITFTFASWEFPLISVCCIVHDTIKGMVTLTFTGYSYDGLPILDFLGLFVLESGRSMQHTINK